MLTQLSLTNYKGFKAQELPLKQITVLVGPNNAGKSSLLEGLLLLKQTAAFPRRAPYLNLHGPLLRSPGYDYLPTNGTERLLRYAYRTDHLAPGQEQPEQGIFAFSWTQEGLKDLSLEFPYSQGTINSLKAAPGRRGLRQSRYPQFRDPLQDPFLLETPIEQETQAANNLLNPVLREKVSRLLQAVLGLELTATPPPDNPRAVLLSVKSPAGVQELNAAGHSVNALLLPLHQVALAPPGATIILEQPEIHLHPQAQANLAEALARAIQSKSQQLLLTTHSEALTTRLLTLVAEQVLTPETLGIYACAQDEKTGLCSAKELEISPEGGIAGGIPDFFQTSLAEMNRYVEAQFAYDREKRRPENP